MSEELPPAPPSLPPQTSAPASDEHTWALVLHLSALLHLLGGTLPGTNILGPLVIWLLKRSDSPYLDEVGKRVLNFQISWAIYFTVAWLVAGMLMIVFVGFLLVPLIAIAFIAWLVFTIIGAVRQSNRESYEFPLTIQFLK
jgi:uncharacterized protein